MFAVYFVLCGLSFLGAGTDRHYICDPDFESNQVFISDGLGKHSEEIDFRRTKQISFAVGEFSFAEESQTSYDCRNNPEQNNKSEDN